MSRVVLQAAAAASESRSPAPSELGSAAPKACWSEKKASDETRLRLLSVSDISSDNRNSRSRHMKCVFLSGDRVYFWAVCRPPLSEHLCDPPERQLPPPDQRSRNGERERERRGVAFQVTMWGIVGSGAPWRWGGCCCQIGAKINSSNQRCARQEAQAPWQLLFLPLFFIGDSFWVTSFIHPVWGEKNPSFPRLPAALLHTFLKLLKLQLFWFSTLPVLTLPFAWFFICDRQIKTHKCQKLPKQHFPQLFFFLLTSDPIKPGPLSNRPFCHGVLREQHRSLDQLSALSGWCLQALWLLCLVPQCPLLAEMSSKITSVCFWSLLLEVCFADGRQKMLGSLLKSYI